MSWHLTAGSLVSILERWEELSWDTRYLMKLYIQESVCLTFNDTQTRGLKIFRPESCIEGYTPYFCWHCGHTTNLLGDHLPTEYGWIKNEHVMYSGYLCPECINKGFTEYFLNGNRDIDIVARHIAYYGIAGLSKYRNRSSGWCTGNPEAQAEVDKDEATVSSWVKQIYDGGNPYGEVISKLEGKL